MLQPILPVTFWTSKWARAVACLAVLAFPASAGVSSAQQGAQSPYPMPSAADTAPLGARPNRADNSPNPAEEEKRRKELNILRQKELTADTARLLLLATQVKDGVDKSGGESPSAELIRKVEQIEKLARSVRSKMSDGIVN